MSLGWSIWVMFLVVLNMGITLSLFLWAPRARIPTLADGTSGHVWAHGAIREGVHRLPRWWLLMSGSMFVGAFGYLVLYPGFGNHKGLLHWSAHGQLERAVAANESRLAPLMQRFRLYPVEQLAADPAAQQLGERLFMDNCAACHGRQATGNVLLGAPDLTDHDWLYGGDGKAITASIHDGRHGVMPAWAPLGEATVDNLAQYVRGLSGQPHDAAMAAKAEPIFKSTCAACHGADGTGNPALGAPNLSDDIWLHGGSLDEIHATIHDGRQGHMPNWDARLGDEQIHVLAAYVYHLSHPEDGLTH
ncbi:MAG TPA: cytochrome-c oxidase, cbb3-type subunit III [Rhodanobacteraceae bacterium]|nr:cytochrome-c oxidase, cbb3-type subunit III [Rhodanobacteraceae bacterium]